MNGAKPWQIAVVIIGLLGGTGLLAWNLFGGEKIRLADSVVLVDVSSGQLFEIDVSGRRGIVVPARHPQTGERTLMPVDTDDHGVWKVDGRHLPLLQAYEPNQRAAVDSSGRVVSASTKITRMRPNVPADQ